ncbi:hypothetical protein [Zooshikella ganghwensis]|uniref:hypothetical protein n=1 Tax=Zooshikella ganghwensis TaxID=202772 RepID=UPI000486E5BA|nr:hypothetical protein [Zooshikella ganghwensis]
MKKLSAVVLLSILATGCSINHMHGADDDTPVKNTWHLNQYQMSRVLKWNHPIKTNLLNNFDYSFKPSFYKNANLVRSEEFGIYNYIANGEDPLFSEEWGMTKV